MESSTATFQHSSNWLLSYYAARTAFSVIWVAAAVVIGREQPLAGLLLAIYPAWDALANFADAAKHGGLKLNPPQSFNVMVSALTTLAVALAISMNAVLGVFGVWASFSGILQLAAAVKRRKTSKAQWAMILSGAQSTLAGGYMLHQALSPMVPSILDVAPYAAFGAFYFMVSTVQLWLASRRTPSLNS